MTKTTKSKTTSKTTVEEAINQRDEVVTLCEALVAEIDNLMKQNLPPAQTGKVLGDIITSFTKQYSVYK